MSNIKQELRQLGIETLYKCMTNPNNRTFYIMNLTLEDVKRILSHPDNDPDYVTDFWTAYHLAEWWWSNIQEPKLEEEYREDLIQEYLDLCVEYGVTPLSSCAQKRKNIN